MKPLLILILFFLTSTCYADSFSTVQINSAIVQQDKKWRAADNKFTNMSEDQKRKMAGSLTPDQFERTMQVQEPDVFTSTNAVLPAKFDWRNVNGKNYITPIKDQGLCGSCYAHSSIAIEEAMLLINNNVSDYDLDLSEQYIITCLGIGSCETGGMEVSVLISIRDKGVIEEKYAPYRASSYLTCNQTLTTDIANITKYKLENWKSTPRQLIPELNVYRLTPESLKQTLVNYGPIVAQFNLYGDFYSYSSGVYSYTSGGNYGAHSVLIVGYDDDDQCFIVKNSWGTSWGENGYFRIAYSEVGINSTTKFAETSQYVTKAIGVVTKPVTRTPVPLAALNLLLN